MQPKVELAQIRNTGEIVDDSILLFKQNWKPLLKTYFIICGFFWAAGLIIAVFNQTKTFQLQEQGESIYSITYFCTILFSFINYTFISLTALSFLTLYREKGNVAPTVEEVWGYVKYYLLRVFSSSVLLVALLAIGLVFCVLPGIYFMPVFSLITTIMVIENADLGYSFNQGFRLIKNNWWQTFGVMLVMGIIVFSAMILLIIPVTIIVAIILASINTNNAHIISMATVLTLHSLEFLYLLPTISIALVYFSLNEKKDDNGLLERINGLGKNNQEANNLPSEEY
jgi:hypothetical protein